RNRQRDSSRLEFKVDHDPTNEGRAMSAATDPADSSSNDLGSPQGQLPHAAPTVSVWAEFGARTHPGTVRPRNEDHYLVARMAKVLRVVKTSLPRDEGLRVSEAMGTLMVVADGMGGAAAGERASALAISGVEALVLNSLKWFLHLPGAEE